MIGDWLTTLVGLVSLAILFRILQLGCVLTGLKSHADDANASKGGSGELVRCRRSSRDADDIGLGYGR
jgi:hypothetical protein